LIHCRQYVELETTDHRLAGLFLAASRFIEGKKNSFQGSKTMSKTAESDEMFIDVEQIKSIDLDSPSTPSIVYQLLAECIGTMFIVIIGVNAVHAAVLANGAAGNFQVGIMFALGIMWGIYTAGPISGGHLNPAITAAIALLRPGSFAFWKVPCYWAAQSLGAFIGGGVNHLMWRTVILNFENSKSIVRGSPASDITASLGFGVFPFPAAAQSNGWNSSLVSPGQALLIEAFGASVLCFIVFMILDARNTTLKSKDGAPLIIGLSIGAMITILSPLTTGCFNPARDFGPRLLGAMTGYGRRAFPGNQNGFWVYLLGPLIGAPIGGAIYDFGLSRAYSGKLF
jgi:glycerol uptake facilitator protein